MKLSRANGYILNAIYIGVCLLGCLVTAVIWIDSFGVLWDLEVYSRAVADLANHLDPYRKDVMLTFVYHPYVLRIFELINNQVQLNLFLPVCYVGGAVFMLWQMYWLFHVRTFVGDSNVWKYYLLVLLGGGSFGGAGVLAMLAGNITPLLHFVLVGALFRFMRLETPVSGLLFVLLIAVVAVVKPYMLAYLLLAFFVFQPVRALSYSFLVVLTVAAIWLSAMYTMPQSYENFMLALQNQTVGVGDIGFAVFGIVRPYLGGGLSLALHVTVMAGLAFMLLYKLPGGLRYDRAGHQAMMLAIVLVIFINPRMKEYDYFIGMMAALIFLFSYFGLSAVKIFLPGLAVSVFPYMAKFFGLYVVELPRIFTAVYKWQVVAVLVVIISLILHVRNRGGSEPRSMHLAG